MIHNLALNIVSIFTFRKGKKICNEHAEYLFVYSQEGIIGVKQ